MVTVALFATAVLVVASALPPAPQPLVAAVASSPAQAVAGDFRGSGRAQIAVLSDPVGDRSMRVTVFDRNGGGAFVSSDWFSSGANSFDLARMKTAAVDANGDGKDDLVALYDDGGTSVRLLVFLSNGSSFTYTGNEGWWRSAGYAWGRARALLAGVFSGSGRKGLLVPYQYDGFQLRIHSLESTGSAFVYTGDQGVYDSGVGQYDATRARFAVGRFTRSDGPQQIAAFYQYPNFRVRIHVFDPSPKGLVPVNGWDGVYDSGEGQYDLARAKIAAADADGDGRSELVSLYGYGDGVRLHVFRGGSSFAPSRGFDGWRAIPGACWSALELVAGDWDGDRRGDVALLSGGLAQASALASDGSTFAAPADAKALECDRWPLSGLVAPDASALARRPFVARIDNASPARPHYGLSEADMIFELLVEGGITRLAAVFHSQDPATIGSIRSARLSDRYTTPMLRGALVYSGATIEETALFREDARAGKYFDLNANYFGWAYRVPWRVAPYNMFTSAQRVREAMNSVGAGTPAQIPAWGFLASVDHVATEGGFGTSVGASALTVPYRSGATVLYQYDAASRTYARWQAGAREVDAANGVAIAARNVVVIYTDIWETDIIQDIFNSKGLDMRLTGEGAVTVFRDGRRQEGTGSRATVFDAFAFRSAAGEPILLSPGQTWIHVVPKEWTIPSQ